MRNLANDTKVSSEKILEIVVQFAEDLEEMQSKIKTQDESQAEQMKLSAKLVEEVQKIEQTTKELMVKISLQ
jgi:hypothetical protein